MERNLWRRLRLSPNEVEAAVRAERDKWKVFRIQQVREQAKEEAKRIREAIRKEELRMVQDLRQDLHLKCKLEKENQVQELQQEYNDCLHALGEAHEQAKRQPDAHDVLLHRAKQNEQKAERRGLEARKVHREQQLQQYHEKNKLLKQRQDALHWEKIRASRVASLPTPEALKKKRYVVEKKVPRVQFHEAGTFTTTNYVPKNVMIEKEVKSTKPTAKEAAVVEEMAQAAREEVNRKEAEEEKRKRQQRGREALAKERLCRMYHQLMNQLDQAQHNHQLSAYLQGTDLSVYETEESRLKHQASQQRQMEKAVEKLLQESTLPSDDDLREHIQLSTDSSDFLKVDETSGVESDQQTLTSKVQDLKSLLEQISKRRHQLLQGIYNCIPEEEETVEEVVDKKSKVVDENDTEHIRKDDVSPEVHQLSTKVASQVVEDIMGGSLDGEDNIHQNSYRGSRHVSRDNEDIHMAETIPFHLFQDHHDSRSTVDSHRNGSQLTSAESSYQGSVSEDTEIRISGITMGTQTSSDEYTRPTSPIIHNLPTSKQSLEYPSSGISTTSYMSPPSSLPTNKVLTRETGDSLKVLNRRKYITSKSFSEEVGDIHMAETVPVHLLPEYLNYINTNAPQTSAYRPSSAKSSFQESSSDYTEGKVHITGSSRVTLTQNNENFKPVMPKVDHLSVNKFPVEYSTSENSSTDYPSPPSTLPTATVLDSEVYANLKKIQQQRQSVQHLLDSISDKKCHRQTSHLKATPPNVYTEKLKGEGSGKRPLRKREKFEIQKKEILQYYMKKLLRMKGDELLNLSASSVEGSGFTVSSLCTLMESVQEKDDILTISSIESYVPSPREISTTNTTSSYKDIDEIPVKLGYSSSKNKNSCKNKLSVTHTNDPSEGYSMQHTNLSKQYGEESGARHEVPQHLQSSATANSFHIAVSSPESMVSSYSQSDYSSPSSGTRYTGVTPDLQRQLEILENLRKLQKLRQDLMMEKDNVLQEESSDKMPDIASSFPSSPEVNTTLPATSSSVKSRKVSFGGAHPRAGLSTIYECSSDLSESHLNMSGSTSYQTPSRECESSLDDTASQVSVSRRFDPGTLRIPLVTRCWSEADMGKEGTAEVDGKKFTHLHTPLDFQPNLSYSELSHHRGTQKSDTRNYLSSDTSEFSSLLGELTQHSGIQSCDNEHSIHSISSSVSLLNPEKCENAMKIKSVLSSPVLYDNQVEAQGDSGAQISGTECVSQEVIGGTSRYIPRDLESTLTSSLDVSAGLQGTLHSNATDVPVKESCKVSSDSIEKHDKQLHRSSSSESVTSIPDMTEILHKFGLDWAESMIRKMEKTERRSSSDSSTSHGK